MTVELELANARAGYGSVEVLHGVNVALPGGAVVAVVGGIGVVGGVVLGGGGGGDTTSSANNAGRSTSSDKGANGAQAAPNSSSNGQARPAIAPGPMARAAAISCPDSPPKLALPGGGGTSQFGTRGALFSAPVESVKVCAYAGGVSGVAPSTVLVGQNATDLTTSIEDAATTTSISIKCPGGPAPTDRSSLVIIGSDQNGAPMKPVVVTLGCPTRVTNGTALRYNWTPPTNLTNLINQGVQPNPTGGPYTLPPSGKVTGSPIRS